MEDLIENGAIFMARYTSENQLICLQGSIIVCRLIEMYQILSAMPPGWLTIIDTELSSTHA